MRKGEPGPQGGRPPLIPEPKDLEAVEELAAEGMSLGDIAGILGVSRRWLEQRVKDIESDLLVPYRRGRAKRARELLDKYSDLEDSKDLQIAERTLRKQLAWLGYSETQRVEADIRQETELTASEGVNITYEVLPKAEEGRRIVEKQERGEELTEADYELIETKQLGGDNDD